MALQGTLDTFALPDVLRLLAATRKTGKLDLRGDRGSGSVWVDSGAVVAVDAPAPAAGTPAEAMFELLRFAGGSFQFEVDAAPAAPQDPVEVEGLLTDAGEMLAEWQTIAAVVPSLDSAVRLRAELPADEVTVDRDRWATLVAVGTGATVAEIGATIGKAELPVSRAVKDLVDAGLAEVTEAAAPVVPLVEPVVEPVVEAADDAVAAVDPVDPAPPVAVETAEPAAPVDEADELARLSPRAAHAMRVAAAPPSDDTETSAADESDENRGMLLKFLSSVKT